MASGPVVQARGAPRLSATRLGVLGDVHGELERVRAALDLFQRERVDLVVAVGDLVDGPGPASATVELLEDAGVHAVAGNHERWLLADEMRHLPHATPLRDVSDQAARFLRSLPRTLEIETPNGCLLVCHGLGEHDMAEVRAHHQPWELEQNAPLQELIRSGRHAYVVNGHTHERLVRRFGAFTLVNAGALLRGDDPCCAVLDVAAERVAFHSLEDPGHPTSLEQLRLDPWAEVF